jgi:hypothetical protein
MPFHGGSTSISSFLRGNSLRYFSSVNLDWPSLIVEQHEAPPGERPEATIESFLLFLWQGEGRIEILDLQGSYVPHVIEPSTIKLYSPGAVPPVNTHFVCNFLLSEDYVRFSSQSTIEREGADAPQKEARTPLLGRCCGDSCCFRISSCCRQVSLRKAGASPEVE